MAGSTTRVELKLKNNRGLVQQIRIPSGVAYADVEDQSDLVRKTIRLLAGQQDIVLLPPGKELRLGFTQPQPAQSVIITPQVNALSLAAELVAQLAGLDQEQGSVGLLSGLLILPGCLGLKSEVAAGAIPRSLDAVKALVESAVRCIIAAASDPKVAVSVAQQLVSLKTGRPLSIVESDASFNPSVQGYAGKINLAGKLAKVVQEVQLAKLAYAIWEGVGELLGRTMVNPDPANVSLDLAAPAPVAASTKVFDITPFNADGSLRLAAQTDGGGPGLCYANSLSREGTTYTCGITADYLPACWPDPSQQLVMDCLRSSVSTSVTQFQELQAPLASNGSSGSRPWELVLADGSRCGVRLGGAWPMPPAGYGFSYECSGSKYAALVTPNGGSVLDTSKQPWTVHAAKVADDNPPLTVVDVKQVIYAGVAP